MSATGKKPRWRCDDYRPIVLQLFNAGVSVGLLADAFETTIAEIENILRQARGLAR